MTSPQPQTINMIRLPQLLTKVGVGKTAIYALIKEEEFPKPVKLGASSVWPEHEVDAWLTTKLQSRPN